MTPGDSFASTTPTRRPITNNQQAAYIYLNTIVKEIISYDKKRSDPYCFR